MSRRLIATARSSCPSRHETLASNGGTWQGRCVSSPASSSPVAGGALIAISTVAGAGIGLFTTIGPTRGFLIGFGAGVAIALAIWLFDRARKPL